MYGLLYLAHVFAKRETNVLRSPTLDGEGGYNILRSI